MARRRLTPLSKLLIVMVIVGALAFGGKWLFDNGYFGDVPTPGDDSNDNPRTDQNDTKPRPKNDDVIRIGVVTWGGYAGGQYWNKGFRANKQSNFYKDYGFQVQFELLDDFLASREAFEADKVDLLWTTIDAFPTEANSLGGNPQVVFQADWSRGGDAIVVRRGIRNVGDLKGKTIAVAEATPSHTFLIWLLNANNLTVDDVKLKYFGNAMDAATEFKGGQVDAAVVWSPDDEDCVKAVAGSRVLENTKNASHIIADVFISKRDYIENNRERLRQLYEGWMKGAAALNGSDAKKREAAKILAEGLEQPEDFCYNAINNVRLTTHGDNMNFFGMNPDYNGVTGEKLYDKMKYIYKDLGYTNNEVPKSWRLAVNKSIVSGVNLNGAQHAAEGQKKFTTVTEADKDKEAISTKQVSISFRTGEYKLDENAKYIIDQEFTDLAKMFSNSRIRVEGNTDNVGSRTSNKALSLKRARSVAEYLQKEHNMDANRFIILGNGPDKPVPGCEANATDDCKAKNRRTDFELVAE